MVEPEGIVHSRPRQPSRWRQVRRIGLNALLLVVLLALPILAVLWGVAASPLAGTAYQAPVAAVLAASVAALLVLALEPRVARLFARPPSQAEAALQGLARQLEGDWNLDELAPALLDAASAITQARHVGLWLRQDPQGVYQAVAWRPGDDDTAPAATTAQIDQNHPLINYLLGTGHVLTAAEFEQLPLFQRLWPQEQAVWAALAAQVVAPLSTQDGLMGLLVAGAPAANGAYAPETLATLEQVAQRAARPLTAARLSARVQQCQAQVVALHDACLELATAQEAEQILYLAVASARHLTDCDVAWAWLLDELAGQVVCRSVVARQEMRPLITAETEFTGLVAQHRTLLVEDASTDPRVKSLVAEQTTGALAAALLPVGQGQHGILVIQNAAPHSLHQHALTLLETQAHYTTLAIANARLETELRRYHQELELRVAARTQELTQANLALHREKDQVEALYEIVRELSTSSQVDQVLGKALRLAASAVGAERGSVMVLGAQSSQLSTKVVLTDEGQISSTNQPTPFQVGMGLAGWVVKHQRSVVVPDVDQDPRWQDLPEMKGTIRSAVALPLTIDAQECVGVLFLAHATPHYFGADHLRILSIVANEMAVAIHNAELDQYVSNQADELAHALREKETTQERMRVIVENVADGVLVNDMEGQILMVNQAAEEVLGIHARTMEGQRWQNIGKTLAPAGYAEVAAFITEATARASYGGFQTVERVFDIAERVIRARLAPVITRSGEALGVVAAFADVTYERELERIKTDFVSTVSHELRTPLTSIKGYVDLVLDGDAGEISPDVRDFLQVVKTNSDRLTALVADLLDISRLEAGRITLDFVPLRVYEIVEQVLGGLAPQIEAGELVVTVDVPKHLPAVRGDRDRVVQIMTNLLSNAIKYTLPGGQVQVQAQASSTHVQISVHDTGIGIAPADQARLFTKFFRADHPLVRQAGGTGLGLPISKTLVDLHGGEMWVTSQVDQGSTFTFTLPLMGRDHGL